MKYRGVRSLPNSVSTWLEHKLEDQGIDSTIYSKYVISLLQHDSVDIANLPDLFESGRNTEEFSWQNLDTEELRKSVAVDYLSAATDQTSGIETLVDELCAKLKEVDSEESNCLKEKTINSGKFNSSPIEIGFGSSLKYYSTFPALNKSTNGSTRFKSPTLALPFLLGSSPVLVKKKEQPVEKDSASKICKRKDGNKENIRLRGRMRSRSTTAKQQIQSRGMTRASAAKSLDRKDEDSSSNCKSGFKAQKHFSYFSESKGRKCLSFREEDSAPFQLGPAHSVFSRTPAPRNSEKFEDLTGCDKDLPMDFQQLLQSPEDDRTTILRGKRRALQSSSNRGNFIQCGTNITSSIWSNDHIEKMDVDSGPNSADETSGISSWECPERSQKRFSTWKGLPFYFKNNTGVAEEEYTMWSDVEGTTLALEGQGDTACRTFFSSLQSKTEPATVSAGSYNGLNHNKDSSFTEVKPPVKPPAEVKESQPCPNGGEVSSQEVAADPATDPQQNGVNAEGVQEEDLLTSMKTHFRPIRQESFEKTTTGGTTGAGGGGAAAYSDGTTFQVSTSLEEVKFDRSESGALYLGCCKDLKYMEFREAALNGADFVPKFRVKQNEKFCQTEDDEEEPEEEEVEGENLSAREDTYEFYFPGDERLAEDMVNRLIDDEDEGGVSDEDTQDQEGGGDVPGAEPAGATASIRVDGWVTTWPYQGEPTSAIWGNSAMTAKKSTSGIIDKLWVFGDGDQSEGGGCDDKGGGAMTDGDHYLRLRHELTQEGEELLSDLSSIHLFLDPDAPTTPPSQAYYHKRMRIPPCPFRSETDSLL